MSLQNNTLIRLDHVSVSREDRLILDDVCLDIKRGDFVAITGPNGGGKTTLLRLMLRLMKPDCGSVDYAEGLGNKERIGYLPQKNMIDSHFPICVNEVIGQGLLGRNIDKSQALNRVRDILNLIGMTDHCDRTIGKLSGGQLQRTLLGRAIISDPTLLLLDEPLSYIDKQFESRFYDIIAEIRQRSSIVLVSHEMTHIAEMANRHFIVDHALHECTAHHHYVKDSCDCQN